MAPGVSHFSTAERRALLAFRHRLLAEQRTDDVVAIADDLVALHSTDPATVFLSVFARMQQPSPDALESALYEERTLIRFHAMRRTVWVASPRMIEAMNASATRKIAGAERRQLLKYLAATEGVRDPEAELRRLESEVLDVIAAAGSTTTRELGVAHPYLTRKLTVGSGRFTTEVGAHTRIVSLAGFEAKLIRGRPSGTWTGSEYAWTPAGSWCDIDFGRLDGQEGSAAVLQRYLDRFGPATETDIRWWTGWTKTAVIKALADIEAVEVTVDSDTSRPANAWLNRTDSALAAVPVATEPWVAVLPGLDPTVMGWKERHWYLTDDVKARVFDRNGNAGPTIWRNGEVVGGWVQQSNGELAFELLRDLSTTETALLDQELERLKAVVGDVRFRLRFPSPNQKDLYS